MAQSMVEHQFCQKKDKALGAKANPMKEEGKYRCTRCGAEFQIAKAAPPPVKVEKLETENKSMNYSQSKTFSQIQRRKNKKSEGKRSPRNQKNR